MFDPIVHLASQVLAQHVKWFKGEFQNALAAYLLEIRTLYS